MAISLPCWWPGMWARRQGELHDMFCSGPNRAHLTKVRVHRRSLLCAWPEEDAHKESFEVFLEDPEGNILVKVVTRRKSLVVVLVTNLVMCLNVYIYIYTHLWLFISRMALKTFICWWENCHQGWAAEEVPLRRLCPRHFCELRGHSHCDQATGGVDGMVQLTRQHFFVPLKELTMLWRMMPCLKAGPQGSIWTWLDQNPNILRYPRKFASPKSSGIAPSQSRVMPLGSCLRLISMNWFHLNSHVFPDGKVPHDYLKTGWQVGMPLWSLKGKKNLRGA